MSERTGHAARPLELWLLASAAFFVAALVPHLTNAQPCNRTCEPSKRDANGCCPDAPPSAPPPTTPAPRGAGTKCATSDECPGDLVCISYRCQKVPAPPSSPDAQAMQQAWHSAQQHAQEAQQQAQQAQQHAQRARAHANEASAHARSAPGIAARESASLSASDAAAQGMSFAQSAQSAASQAVTSSQQAGTATTVAAAREADFRAQNYAQQAQQYAQQASQQEQRAAQYAMVAMRAGAAAASLYDWVGIAWNSRGGCATRAGATQLAAQAAALDACNTIAGGGCVNVANPVPGDRLQCFSIHRSGTLLFEAHNADQASATASALQNCRAGGHTDCQQISAACNTHQ